MTSRVKGGTAEADDGRSSRWTGHRQARRTDFVTAAVAAIDTHGPSAGVDEIAAAAGVSKPVLYRYFDDKADIYTAVGQWGAALVMERLLPALLAEDPVKIRVERAVDAYLGAIEEHPNVFLLLVRHRAGGAADPLADGKAAIAATIARVMGDLMRELGVDTGGAEPWAHGLVGLGLATGEWWVDRQTLSRAHVGAYLSDFIWHALDGIARSYGVEIDSGSGPGRVGDPEAYAGPARLLVTTDDGDRSAEVRVTLRGGFQPIDGLYRWWGRLEPDEELATLVTTGSTVTIRTPHGEALGRLSDVDPWGRLRISGTGRPPFPPPEEPGRG